MERAFLASTRLGRVISKRWFTFQMETFHHVCVPFFTSSSPCTTSGNMHDTRSRTKGGGGWSLVIARAGCDTKTERELQEINTVGMESLSSVFMPRSAQVA